MKKKALIISYHFYPNSAVGAKRPSELALSLLNNGYEVSVICAKLDTDENLLEKTQGLDVTYITPPPSIVNYIVKKLKSWRGKDSDGKNNNSSTNNPSTDEIQLVTKENNYKKLRRWYFSMVALGDALKTWTMMVCTFILYMRLKKKFDIVISSGPPMAAHYAAILAKKINHCPWVLDLRDPFPVISFLSEGRTFMNDEVKSTLRKNLEFFLEKKCIMGASLIVTASPGIGKDLTDRYENIADKIQTIYNGYDKIDFHSPSPQREDKKIIFLYAGMIYYNRNPFPLLNSFHRFVSDYKISPDQVSLLFYGKCEEWRGKNLNSWIKEHDMDSYIKIHPPVDKAEITKIMSNADILVNFSQGQLKQVPAKTFDYIGMKKYMLTIAEEDSSTAILLREVSLSTTIDPTQDDFSKEIFSLYTKASENIDYTAIDITEFSRAHQNAKYLNLIEKL